MPAFDLPALLLVISPVTADALPTEPAPQLQEAPLSQEAGAQAVPDTGASLPELPVESAPAADTLDGSETAAGLPEEIVTDEIVVMADPPAPPGDPLVELNETAFEATQAVDVALVEPISEAYEDALPEPVRAGLRNFMRNLASPVIFINFVLQGKPGRAFQTLGRFAVNTTVGVAGLVDVAKNKPFDLPYRPNGFANTLGFYGVGPGPYFYLPLVGSTTLRDAFGGLVDSMVLPTAVGGPFADPYITVPRGVIRSLDYRVEYDEQIKALRDDVDPYTTQKEGYLAARQAEIDALRGVHREAPAVIAPAETVPGRHGATAGPLLPEEVPASPQVEEAPQQAEEAPPPAPVN